MVLGKEDRGEGYEFMLYCLYNGMIYANPS